MLKSAVRGFSCLAVLCLSAACVNQIGDEDVAESNIPISFSAKVSKASTVTRVSNSGFEAGDRIGLFATMGVSMVIVTSTTCGWSITVLRHLSPNGKCFIPKATDHWTFWLTILTARRV